MRNTLLITGAAGGMGRACARLFSTSHDLVLTDVATSSLDHFAEDLRDEGAIVASARTGDLNDEGLLNALLADLGDEGPVTLIHTAGVSPSQGDWCTIMNVNFVASVRLLNAIEPRLRPGSAAVLVASIAGHMFPAIPEVQAILDQPLAQDLLDQLAPMVGMMAQGAGPSGDRGVGYGISKSAVLRLVEQRAKSWGERGARIVSISPGMIMTPMGRREMAETPGATIEELGSPLKRAGAAMEIAFAARFLLSGDASFITGTDLRIDGGSIAVQRSAAP
jgi:NAD(P)-dependent dehydrogenase (short-subunit alcohol dehydrogenase family)